jgi:hypothetical protein
MIKERGGGIKGEGRQNLTNWEDLIRDQPAVGPYCPETDCANSSQIMNVLTLEKKC